MSNVHGFDERLYLDGRCSVLITEKFRASKARYDAMLVFLDDVFQSGQTIMWYSPILTTVSYDRN